MIWLSDPQFQTKDFGTLENVLYLQSTYNINQNVCIWDREKCVSFLLQKFTGQNKGINRELVLEIKNKIWKKKLEFCLWLHIFVLLPIPLPLGIYLILLTYMTLLNLLLYFVHWVLY